jgi:ubiquitin-conjugating enzyme E2 variant
LIEGIAIMCFQVLVIHGFVTIAAPAPWQALVLTVLALPVAYFFADLFTGIVHWICDSFGTADTPVWGPMLVGPFRRHHQTPREITRISLVENLGASCIAGTGVLWFWFPGQLHANDLAYLFALHFWLWLVVFAVVSNLFHRWSHRADHDKPRWMQNLQRWRLILNTQDHLTHHRKPHLVNYCILSGWANPLSNRIPWRRIEAALATVGIKTQRET